MDSYPPTTPSVRRGGVAVLLRWLPAASAVGLAAVLLAPMVRQTPAEPMLWGLRALLVVAALAGWHYTQARLGGRLSSSGTIDDGIHRLTAPIHAWLSARPRWSDALLIASSFCIDFLGAFLLGLAVFGPSLRPLVGLVILFGLRQLCQRLCALPPPQGMIWRDPGAASLLVTYHVSTDLFFSGHTALGVYGVVELAAWGGVSWLWPAAALAVFLCLAVLVLRAHYTMDVFAAFAAALLAAHWAGCLSPTVDSWLALLIE